MTELVAEFQLEEPIVPTLEDFVFQFGASFLFIVQLETISS